MIIETQSVDQTVSAMGEVLKKYLNSEEIRSLTAQWRQYPTVSIKLIQELIIETTRRYPELQAYRSEIRRGFINAMQAKVQVSTHSNKNSEPIGYSEVVGTFYTVITACSNQLNAPDKGVFFDFLHRYISQDRTFKGHNIDVSSFLSDDQLVVPDDINILSNIMQLAYVCLCDIVGPVAADEILFVSAETAKQSHPKEMVEKSF